MTNVFTFVGTHRDDPDCLLLLGDDGDFYAVAAPDGPAIPIEPDEEWVFDDAVAVEEAPPSQ